MWHRRRPAKILIGAIVVSAINACRPAADGEAPAQPAITAAKGDVAAIDDRVAIPVDAATRYAILTEMRTMLNAVQGVVGGAASGDTAAMRSWATAGGMAAASESGEEVAAQLGANFVTLGLRTHASFDSLAMDVAQGKSGDAVLKRLSTVMGNCIGCHNQYRITVQP